mgnify:CR=1 FL=1
MPQSLEKQRPLDADRAHASKTCSHVVLPLCGVVRQRSSRHAASGERDLVLDREVLAGELRVRDHDDLVDAFLERAVDDGEGVVAAEVSGGEDQTVPGDRAEHVAGLRQERPPAPVTVAPARLPSPRLAELVLEAGPLRDLVARLRLRTARGLRRRVDGRHPDDACALAGGDLDRERVHPADGLVERDRPDRPATPGTTAETTCARSAVEV